MDTRFAHIYKKRKQMYRFCLEIEKGHKIDFLKETLIVAPANVNMDKMMSKGII